VLTFAQNSRSLARGCPGCPGDRNGARPVTSLIQSDGLPTTPSSIRVLLPPVEPSQYASAQIAEFAAANGITRSMGLTGICRDNAMAESFFATLKTEFYYRRVWTTRARAAREVGSWIEDRYNRRRKHSSIGQISPVDFEMQHSSEQAQVQLAA